MALREELAAYLGSVAGLLLDSQTKLENGGEKQAIAAVRAARLKVVRLRDDFAAMPADAKIHPSKANDLASAGYELERLLANAPDRAKAAIRSAMQSLGELLEATAVEADGEWEFVRE